MLRRSPRVGRSLLLIRVDRDLARKATAEAVGAVSGAHFNPVVSLVHLALAG